MQLNYRPLRLEDLALVQKLGRETYEPYYPHIWKPGGLDWYMEHCFGATVLSKELVDPNIAYWVAETEAGEAAGLLKLVLHKPSPAYLPEHPSVTNALYLEKVYLMPAFYRTGTGQHLIEFAKEQAVALGREAVWLMVMSTGPVWAYERAGFQIIGALHWDFELLKMEERGGWAMLYNKNAL